MNGSHSCPFYFTSPAETRGISYHYLSLDSGLQRPDLLLSLWCQPFTFLFLCLIRWALLWLLLACRMKFKLLTWLLQPSMVGQCFPCWLYLLIFFLFLLIGLLFLVMFLLLPSVWSPLGAFLPDACWSSSIVFSLTYASACAALAQCISADLVPLGCLRAET